MPFLCRHVDQEGVLHNVFVQREAAGRIEVALAETATYSKANPGGMHLVTLFNGRRYEGVPGQDDFRVIEFREHGFPSPRRRTSRPFGPDTKPKARSWARTIPPISRNCNLGHLHHYGAVLTLSPCP